MYRPGGRRKIAAYPRPDVGSFAGSLLRPEDATSWEKFQSTRSPRRSVQ
jgi:hypothetical protein